MSAPRPRSSRQRYDVFVEDYKHQRLDEALDAQGKTKTTPAASEDGEAPPEKRSGLGLRRGSVASISASICDGCGHTGSR